MWLFFYKLKRAIQDFSHHVSLKYREFFQEIEQEIRVAEIRKEYQSWWSVFRHIKILKTLFLSLILFLLFVSLTFFFFNSTQTQNKLTTNKSSEQKINVKGIETPRKEEPIQRRINRVKKEEKEYSNSQKSNYFLKSETESKYIILVDKEKKKLKLAELIDDKFFVVESFVVSIGKVMGNKGIEGDLKTPEGKYKIIEIKQDGILHEQYGPYAFVLNYPNELDKARGRTGSGIWIHGSGADIRSPDTKGCVELSNKDLLRLRNYIKKGTPVYIYPKDTIGLNGRYIQVQQIGLLSNELEKL